MRSFFVSSFRLYLDKQDSSSARHLLSMQQGFRTVFLEIKVSPTACLMSLVYHKCYLSGIAYPSNTSVLARLFRKDIRQRLGWLASFNS